MNSSRSFDRAASFYDQTRPFRESIAKPGVQAILDITGPKARILDVGTGTGRISIPVLKQGLDLIGCDLSSKMLMRLQEKFPSARIAQSDASALPFPSACFDIVLTAHVLHLIPTWREALREFQRVLVPGGAYLNLKTWANVGISIRAEVTRCGCESARGSRECRNPAGTAVFGCVSHRGRSRPLPTYIYIPGRTGAFCSSHLFGFMGYPGCHL